MQMVVQIVVLAFVVVGGTCGLLIPVLLYILNLHTKGWNWPYAALLGAMLASTDAVAIVAVMKTSACHLFQLQPCDRCRASAQPLFAVHE